MADPFIGEIRMAGFNFAPRGWAFCNGALFSIAQNTALFSLLGTMYGGNGQTTFGLPNLMGRIPLHMGQGPGLTNREVGEMGGQEAVTLIQAQIPAHSHVAHAATGGARAATAAGNMLASGEADVFSRGTGQATTLAPGQLDLAGGSQPHPNIQPSLGVSFIIAIEGIYPSRN